MSEFRMPSLGADMEAGTLVEWHRHPGDTVKRGDIIAVVDTQKGAIEIEVFEDGVVESIAVEAGQKVPVGTVLAVIRTDGAQPQVAPGAPQATAPAPSPIAPAQPAAGSAVSPGARRRARELGLDLTGLQGTGPAGAITRGDVERLAAAKGTAAPPAVSEDRSKAMRAAIAAAMARSKREIPHYYLSTLIDMSATLEWLRVENERRPMTERLLPLVPMLKAVALALREIPELNGFWIDGAFRPAAGIHVGCAIALRGGGLIAPGVHDVDRKDLASLMRDVSDLVTRARAGALRSSELSDPTITVTNLGDEGVDEAFGIIYPPQVALVGFGRITERAMVRGGRIEARRSLVASLAADHRASDGHRGGRFLTAIDRLLQHPEQL